MKKPLAFAIAITIASAIAAGCAVQTGNEVMSKKFSLEGFQAANLPHPGTITFIESWNDKPKTESADQYPDSFKFRCIDENEDIVPRDRAQLCIPIMEFNVKAVDEAGNPHPFKGAHFISITAYGPNHRFVEVTDSVPQSPSPLPEPPRISPKTPSAPAPPGARLATQSSVSARKPMGFWERIRKAMRGI
jgi:hypothetical protein